MNETKNDYSSIQTFIRKMERQVKVIQWTGNNRKEIEKFLQSVKCDYKIEKRDTSLFLVEEFEGSPYRTCKEVKLCDFMVYGFGGQNGLCGNSLEILSEAGFKMEIEKRLLKD